MTLKQDILLAWQEVEMALKAWYQYCQGSMKSPQNFQEEPSFERRLNQGSQTLKTLLEAAMRLMEERDEIKVIPVDVSRLISTVEQRVEFLDIQKMGLTKLADTLQEQHNAIGKREAERRLKRLYAVGLAHLIHMTHHYPQQNTLFWLQLAVEASRWGLIPQADLYLQRFLQMLILDDDTSDLNSLHEVLISSPLVIRYLLQQAAIRPDMVEALEGNAKCKSLIGSLPTSENSYGECN